MQVSVIIPVFNAETFIERAVSSALAQPEVEEVILVEDESEDGSLAICEEIARRCSHVKLFRHAERRNRGPGGSRNLGIRQASCEWLAFLDADDFYLPNRFGYARAVIESNQDCDAVCEAVGVHFDDEGGRERWENLNREMVTTFDRPVPWEDMFEAQLGLLCSEVATGHTCTPGLLVRKRVAVETGLYPERLRLHQDTVFQAKVAALGRMCTGELVDPVAMRGVHVGNRSSRTYNRRENQRARLAMWKELYSWGKKHLSNERLEKIAITILKVCLSSPSGRALEWRRRGLLKLYRLTIFFMIAPGALRHREVRKEVISVLRFAVAAAYRHIVPV